MNRIGFDMFPKTFGRLGNLPWRDQKLEHNPKSAYLDNYKHNV